MLFSVVIVALACTTPSAAPVPRWVVDLAATNPDPTYWGQVQFAVHTAHSLLRSGWRTANAPCWRTSAWVNRAATAGLASKTNPRNI